jgi:hypothetical protein
MIITYTMLLDAGACFAQRLRFNREFNGSVRVSKARCIKYTHTFDFDWAGCCLFTGKRRRAYLRFARTANTARFTERDAVWIKYRYDISTRTRKLNEIEAKYAPAFALAFWQASKVKP